MSDEPNSYLVHHEGRRYAYDKETHQLYDVDFPDKRTSVVELEAAIAKNIEAFEANGGLRNNREACSPLASLSVQLDAALGRETSELTRKLATAWQLPVLEIAEGRFFVDKRLNEMRNVDDPHHTIDLKAFQLELIDMARHLGSRGGVERVPAMVEALAKRAADFQLAMGNDPTDFVDIIRKTVAAETPDELPERKRNRALN